ncbi:hypothetical protein K491DRAFT_714251 [Lophiostoma macrostomum CBS 122681]|uniref:Uncharacterized protein n=1 Tax=Lophiostoma macrostomum CBS 122681 TaxID=1314788 RepID=A0A6A6TD57_9PLEO|nr:hypothetical protein K491DRAFT_714251 [Lophiostoma macrostomum CBS 122681]
MYSGKKVLPDRAVESSSYNRAVKARQVDTQEGATALRGLRNQQALWEDMKASLSSTSVYDSPLQERSNVISDNRISTFDAGRLGHAVCGGPLILCGGAKPQISPIYPPTPTSFAILLHHAIAQPTPVDCTPTRASSADTINRLQPPFDLTSRGNSEI